MLIREIVNREEETSSYQFEEQCELCNNDIVVDLELFKWTQNLEQIELDKMWECVAKYNEFHKLGGK